MPITLIVLIFVGTGGFAIAAYLWLTEQSRRGVVERAISGGGVEVRPSVLRPLANKPMSPRVEKLLQRAPSVWTNNETIKARLIHAGYDGAHAPAIYATVRVVSIILFPLLGLLLLPIGSAFQMFIVVVAGAFVGLILPSGFLMRAAGRRQQKIRRALPDALDLLVICVEAGMSLDAALLRVAKDMVYVHPDLSRELLIVNRKTNAGVAREVALRGLWERTGVEEIRTLVSSLIQSEKWGTSSSRVLRVSAETLRRKRRFAAEKKAATAPIKMLIPMALLIFPALFVVILGPAVQKIFEAFSGK
jgi:tight adherence protein C